MLSHATCVAAAKVAKGCPVLAHRYVAVVRQHKSVLQRGLASAVMADLATDFIS